VPSISDFTKFAFVVGAPRCGTTTIARLLRNHPQLCFSLVKEPHFFSQHDLRGLSEGELRERVEQEYLERFFRPPSAGQIGAEASVSYLYTPEQMEPVLRLWPESRFVIAVRDPMSLLPSLHQRLIYIGDETITRFQDAWAAIPDRTAGRRIPRNCADPRWLRYDEAGRLGTYVERFFSAVGRERCLVVVFDDLIADPRATYRQILDFVGVESAGPIDVPPARESRQVRSLWLQRLLKRPPRPLQRYLASHQYRRRLNGDAGPDHTGVEKILSARKRLLRWNWVEKPPAPVPPQVAEDIRLHLHDEVRRLEALIGRDLGHWLQPRTGSSNDASP
jgi:hypothetical protein